MVRLVTKLTGHVLRTDVIRPPAHCECKVRDKREPPESTVRIANVDSDLLTVRPSNPRRLSQDGLRT